MARPIITLTTDFGADDPYVGTMKGVVLGICPDAEIVDLTHEVPPQDIRAGAFLFSTAYAHFPAGTVHVIVVDPGVGTSRRPIAVAAHGVTFVCPDNGLLSYVLRDASDVETRHLTNADLWRPDVSSTFHGRDVFAPVAAHLAAGTPFDSVGPAIDDLVTFAIPEPQVAENQVLGEVVHVDHYGNLVTNIGEEHLAALGPTPRAWRAGQLSSRQSEATRDPAPLVIEVADVEIEGLSQTFQDADGLVALIGSNGTLEIAYRNGNAAAHLSAGRGATVWVRVS